MLFISEQQLANAYNQAVEDVQNLESMLIESEVGLDHEPILIKKEDPVDNLGYPYKMKKNYNIDHLARLNFKRSNLDHLARMNFKRSDSDKRVHPSKFNQRHILGGLRRK